MRKIGPDLFRKACEFDLEGLGLDAPRSRLPRRRFAELAQGEKPGSSGYATG
jgi:hypothetical protein